MQLLKLAKIRILDHFLAPSLPWGLAKQRSISAVAQALLPAQLGRSCIGGVTVQAPLAMPQVAPALRHPLLPAPANYPWYPYISLDSGNAPR